MRLLVTGGSGFIGSSLIRHIIKNSEHQVLNLDKLSYAGNKRSLAEVENSHNYFFERADICDRKKIAEIFEAYKPDGVIHLAAESHVDRSIQNPDNFIFTNIIGTFSLLETTKSYYSNMEDKIKRKAFRFHHVSTDEVYGDLGESGGLFSETTPYSPSSPYSASKASSDHLVRAWGRTFGIPIIITNCSNNYGPFHFPEKLIPRMIINALNGKSLPVYGDGSQIRDWLFVEDHVRALLIVFFNGTIGDTYNIGGEKEKTNLEVVTNICDLLDELAPEKPRNIESFSDLIIFVKDRLGHDIRYAVDTSKIKKTLGWEPKESFNTGLRKTVIWYLQNRMWWENVTYDDPLFKRVKKNNE